jgi:hypothetical protein
MGKVSGQMGFEETGFISSSSVIRWITKASPETGRLMAKLD